MPEVCEVWTLCSSIHGKILLIYIVASAFTKLQVSSQSHSKHLKIELEQN